MCVRSVFRPSGLYEGRCAMGCGESVGNDLGEWLFIISFRSARLQKTAGRSETHGCARERVTRLYSSSCGTTEAVFRGAGAL